jgi:murein DD-endopeptidase MepM/ murein hydrolase activator NlpD
MIKQSLQQLQSITAYLVIALLIGCSPSPKYRGHPRRTKRRHAPSAEKERHTEVPETKGPVGLTFMPPVRNFRTSRISSFFGVRKDPRYKTSEFHQGIDIRGAYGEDVLASAPGTVAFAGNQSGFGKVIIIEHGQRYFTVYGHLNSTKTTVGSAVAAGDVIGTMGRTGNATGVHLHFEIRKSRTALNPLDYLYVAGD